MMEATTEAASRSATQLDPAFVERWSRDFFAAWCALDADAVAALCAEDVVWHDPTMPEAAHGRDEVRAFVRATARAFPDFTIVPVGSPCASPAEPVVLTRYRMTATMRGTWEYSGLPATGRQIEIPGVDEITFRGEQVSHYRTYFDRFEMARQLGVMPPPGSFAERAMTRLQHARARRQGRRTA